jgi:hypothetical protein
LPGRWDGGAEEPAASVRREESEDHLSFIESIGLYWLNPASGESHGGPWISDASIHESTADRLGEGEAGTEAETADSSFASLNLQLSRHHEMPASNSHSEVASERAGDEESSQIEELDFLSMLGLTKVGAGGGGAERGDGGGFGGGQAKKWRLWQPEVSNPCFNFLPSVFLLDEAHIRPLGSRHNLLYFFIVFEMQVTAFRKIAKVAMSVSDPES